MLIDLINNKELKNQGYGIVHFDSPDERGVDVGLLFNTNRFTPIFTKAYSLYLKRENGETDFTRDHLLVSGYLDKELIHFIVNHWPSRSGGRMRSENTLKGCTINFVNKCNEVLDFDLHEKLNNKYGFTGAKRLYNIFKLN